MSVRVSYPHTGRERADRADTGRQSRGGFYYATPRPDSPPVLCPAVITRLSTLDVARLCYTGSRFVYNVCPASPGKEMGGVSHQQMTQKITAPAFRENVAICEQCDKSAVLRVEAHSVEETRTAYELISGNEHTIEEHVEACQSPSVDEWYCEEHAPEFAPEAWKALGVALAGQPIPPTND